MLNKAVQAAFADPAMKAKLADTGGAPLPGTAADFARLMAAETEKWGKVVKAAGHQGGVRRSRHSASCRERVDSGRLDDPTPAGAAT